MTALAPSVCTRTMPAKMLVTALALLTVESGPCSSADYTPCYDSPLVVPVPAGVDGGAATDGGTEAFQCSPLCAPMNDGKPFAGCELSTVDGGAPTVTCHYRLNCGA